MTGTKSVQQSPKKTQNSSPITRTVTSDHNWPTQLYETTLYFHIYISGEKSLAEQNSRRNHPWRCSKLQLHIKNYQLSNLISVISVWRIQQISINSLTTCWMPLIKPKVIHNKSEGYWWGTIELTFVYRCFRVLFYDLSWVPVTLIPPTTVILRELIKWGSILLTIL